MTQDTSKLIMAMVAQGQELARAFAPAMEGFNTAGFEKLVPQMSKDMLEMFFGRTFNREGLDARTRFLVTIAGLVATGAQGEPQLRLALRNALEAGATETEINETIFQMSMFGGLPAMTRGLEIAKSVFGREDTSGENT